MKLADFLQDLSLQGVKLWADGDRLRTAGSQTVLTSNVVEQLKQHKSAILQLLHEHPNVLNVHPLSHGQRALWFLWQLAPESSAYNFSFTARIHTAIDADTWRSLFQILVERHSILRSTFPNRDGEPFQHIHLKQAVDFATIDASTWSNGQLNQNLIAISEAPFDLETESAMRVKWITRSAQEHVLLIVAHHIVFDGWSQSILFKELATLYRASLTGNNNDHHTSAHYSSNGHGTNGFSTNGHRINNNIATALAPLEHTYQDYVEWQKYLLESDKGEQLWQYWQQQLAGDLPILNLPTDHPRPPVKTYRGAMQSFQLAESLTQHLKELAKTSGVTLYVLLMAAFQILLHRYSGQEDILIGSPSLGRSQLKFSEIVGYFVDPMVLRADLSGNPTFSSFLTQVRQTVLDGLAHQDYPFALQVEQLQPRRDPSYSPIFQACFTYLVPLQDAKGEIDWGELGFEPFELPRNRSQFDLHLEMSEVDVSLVGGIEYSTDLFNRESIERMVTHFQTLLASIVANPEQRLRQLSLLPKSEYQQQLIEWNNTVTSYPTAQCIHQLFEAQVERTPTAVAVNFNTQQLTYQTLNQRANQLAHYLQTLGVGPEVLVGIYVERSPNMMVGLLGILKTGGAYVPLDPGYPKERITYMLQDSAASVVLTQQTLVADLPDVSAQVICLDTDWAKIADGSDKNVKGDAQPANLAYVIYTSGSTGQPKGVEILHQGLMNYLCWCTQTYRVSEGAGALVHSSIGFDATITGLFSPLLVGKTVFLLPEDEGIEGLAAALQTDNNFSLVKLTPAHLKALGSLIPVKRLTQQTRALVIGGEALVKDVIAPWLIHAPNTRLINEYGPTETVVGCCIYEVDSYESLTEPIPIGRPIANTKLYILDSQLQPLPTGVPGELCIGGEGVARGYRNRPELSAEKFISNPFGSGRLYKTGDLARYRPDGNVEYLGRIDHQVKIRGFRIELGEIEAILNDHAQLQQAVVIAREDHTGDKQLVAYVVSTSSLIPEELRDFLKAQLPEYMVPDVFVQLPDLPLTANGKVDRKALPAPERLLTDVDDTFAAPQTSEQKLIATIFSDVLKVSPVGLHQSFFELGGHSLLATQLIVRLREAFDVDISLKLLFEASTVEGLASAIAAQSQLTSHSKNLPQIQPEPEHINRPFPLNDIQQAYWLGRDASFDLGNVATQIYIELDCQDLDLDRLDKSLQRLIQHHAMLRAVILPAGSQQILPEVPTYKIAITDLSDLGTERQTRQLATIRQNLSHRMLPANQWPLFGIKATRLGAKKTRLHLNFDALLADAASLQLLGHQWIQLYNTPEMEFSTLKLSFRDYVLAEQQLQTSEKYQQDEHYWFSRLDSLPPAPELPLAVQPNQIENPRFQRRSYRLNPEHWQILQVRGKQADLTPSGILLAAFSEVLSLWSRQAHFTLNLTTFKRLPLHPEVNDIVGDFTSLTLLEVDFRQQLTFEERARRLQKQLFEDLDHLQCNGIRVLRELTRHHSTQKQVAMPVVFTSILGLRSASETSNRHDITDLGEVAYSVSQTPQVWLDHQVSEDQGALVFSWDTLEALFPAGMIDAMFATYCRWLEQLATDETAWHQTRRHQLLPKAQQKQRAESNNTTIPIRPTLLQELFTDQLPQRFEQPAVIAPDCSITYGQLAQMAQCLGQKLQQQGVQSNTLVAIVLEKSWLQVVAVLGSLISGAAYVPIDPQQPRQRQQQILEQSQAELIITHSSLIDQIGVEASHQIWALDQLVTLGQAEPLSAWDWVQKPDDLAYVIFTSGSTGKPKGVAIDHRGAVNTLLDINRRFSVTSQDRVLALSALNFDLSVYDIFGILAAGGTIVMPEPQHVKEPAHWLTLIRQHRITLWNTVPALAQMLADYLSHEKAPLPSSLRLALLSGDWLPLDLPGKLQQLWTDIQINSLGGATEASIWSITYPIDVVNPDWKSIPYGKPLANQTFAVLNDQFDPCPVWVPGDLYIGGIGLAIGYWQDQARTAASFINHPVTGERLYKTGDLGRYFPDGNIEFLGRKDFQVKIRGFRVELGEIEATLNQHPAVKQTVANTVGESLNRQLVAYVVAESESAAVNLAEAHDPSQLADVILDPVERIEFKLSQPGLKNSVPSSQVIQLLKPVFDGDLEQRYLVRQSYRQFASDSRSRASLEQMLVALTRSASVSKPSTLSDTTTTSLPLSLESLSKTLSSLMGFLIEGAPLPKYLYPSAGNLYPVQLYLRVTDGAIADVAAGVYYYHPLNHTLIKQKEGRIDSAVSLPKKLTNPGVELFLIGQLPAIKPLYGRLADTFCALEAGYMLEVLRHTATEQNLSFTIPSRSTPELIQALGLDPQQHLPLLQCVLSSQDSSAVMSSGLALKSWFEESDPLQLYLYLKPDHWDDLKGGMYRYDPDSQALTALSSDAQLSGTIYGGNQPIFDQASFSLFLVAPSANTHIPESLGSSSRTKELLKAGMWGQTLMLAAPHHQLGLCPIGYLPEKEIVHSLQLERHQHVVHSFLGGGIEVTDRQQWLAFSTKPTVVTAAEQLRQFLQERLPAYMVPAIFMSIEAIPLTANGKVNRQALPVPVLETGAQLEYSSLKTPTQEIIANLIESVLRVGPIGLRDNFFELGGDSLLATQLIVRLRAAFDLEIPLRNLFEFPTVFELEQQIQQIRQEDLRLTLPPITPVVPRDGQQLPLSWGQERLCFLDQLEGPSATYNVPAAVHLSGHLNITALEQAFNYIVQRHEILRTRYPIVDGSPVQEVVPDMAITLMIQRQGNDLSLDDWQARIEKTIQKEARTPFDLATGPLLRTGLQQYSDTESVLLITMHHIIADRWSVGIFVQEMAELYRAYIKGREPSLAPMAIQYGDYALWQRRWLQGTVLEKQLDYWLEQLADMPTLLQLPTDYPRPAVQSYRGAHHSFHLSLDLTRQLEQFSQRSGVTLFMTLLAGFGVLLSRYSGQSDLSIGSPIANRNQAGIEPLIGYFSNTLVLRLQPEDDLSFTQFLQRVREMTLDSYVHQDVPFEQLVEALQPKRSLSHAPLFQVMFLLRTAPHTEPEMPGLILTSLASDTPTTKVDLTLAMTVTDAGLECSWQYSTDLFKSETIERMSVHLQRLLESAVTMPDQSLSRLPLLQDTEQYQLLQQWNDTAVEPFQPQCIHQLFTTQVARVPTAIAVIYEGQQLTYQELDQRSNQVAHYLRARGVEPGTLVGICLERSLDMVVGLLGILKAGGAYVPLDPGYPQERLTYMLQDAAVSVLLTQESLRSVVPAQAASVICLDADWPKIAKHSVHSIEGPVQTDDLAYVIYTSGSTGTPKGIMISHASVYNYTTSITAELALEDCQNFLLSSTLAADLGNTVLWPALCGGKCLHLLAEEKAVDGALFANYLTDHAIDVVKIVPTHLAALQAATNVQHRVLPRKRLILGGDITRVAWVQQLQRLAPGCWIVNHYGPTETTVGVLTHRFQTETATTDQASLPIGRPLANTQIYILDTHLQSVPIGVAGELCIGGAGLAQGYLNRPELTAQKFIANPLIDSGLARLYKTGDLARYLPDGTIEFLGRIDHQVKVRGFRIELGEVESILLGHAAVQQAVVDIWEEVPGNKRLIAYWVSQDPTLTPGNLRSWLQAKLPDHMVPAACIQLETLPLTKNGKVDRQALPTPDLNRPKGNAFAPPQTVLQCRLADIWKQVLRIDQVGLHDNFFTIGGDSILSIQVVSRSRQAGIDLKAKQIFQYQTIAELARVVDFKQGLEIPQTRASGHVPLTPIQTRFFAQNWSEPHHFNQAVLLSVSRHLNLQYLEAALATLFEHHDALRLRYIFEEQEWQQIYGDAPSPLPLEVVDLSHHRNREYQLKVLASLADKYQASLNLNDSCLMQGMLFQLGDTQGTPEARLLLIVHHLVVDGVSWRILLSDLALAYHQIEQGQSVQLPAKTSSFQIWSQHLQSYAQSDELRRQMEHWLNQPWARVQSMPVDYDQNLHLNQVASQVTVDFTLSQTETRQLLRDVPAAYNTQINDILLTALVQCLQSWMDNSVVLINLEGHGRQVELFENLEISRTVGWFTSLFPVVLQLQPQADVATAIKSIKEQLRQIPNAGIGYGIARYLSEDSALREQLTALPEGQISFNYLGQFDEQFDGGSQASIAHGDVAIPALGQPALEASGGVRSPQAPRSHLLDVSALVVKERLQVSWIYSREIYEQATVERLAHRYQEALQGLIYHCLSPATGGYTPSDFPGTELSQEKLDKLLATVGQPTVESIYPLSGTQQGLLFHALYTPNSGVYLTQTVVTIEGAVDVIALRQTWQALMNRHGCLRTVFAWETLDQPLQIVCPTFELPWTELDWRNLTAKLQEQQLNSLLEQQREQGVDLTQAPAIALHLIQVADQRYHLVWSHHHILMDGWCLPVLFQEMLTFYQAYRGGHVCSLKLPRPYQDYIQWLQRQDMAAADTFWREMLQGVEAPTPLPFEQLGLHHQSTAGFDEQQIEFSPALTQALQTLVQAQEMTLASFIQAVWGLLLGRYSGDLDVVFGVTVSGRSGELTGVETMVGLFINTLPLRVSMSHDEKLLPWLQRLHRRQLELQNYAYSALADVQKLSDIEAEMPLFESIFVFENYPVEAAVQEQAAALGLSFTGLRNYEQTSYPLTLTAIPGERLQLTVSYDTSRFSKEAMERLLGHWQVMLAAIAANPHQSLGEIPLLTAAERHQLLVQWNDTTFDIPQDKCIHQLFEAQARKTPSAIAVAFEDEQLSYGQLEARANQLAHRLRELGVEPEVLVGLCVERSIHLVVGMLGILKAGGVYVPLDSTYPSERLSYMLNDTSVDILLTQRSLTERLPTSQAKIIYLDDDTALLTPSSDISSYLDCLAQPRNLAYVIYTSGSTGKPKGAMVEHLGCINHCYAKWHDLSLTHTDIIAQTAPIGFDISVWQTLTMLLIGGKVEIIQTDTVRDPERLFAEVQVREISILQVVPSLLRMMLEICDRSGPPQLKNLRWLVVTGEAFPTELRDWWFTYYPDIPLVNAYGPAECSDDVTHQLIYHH
ncbi:amino acid adenylation domain-containing protein [Leptolyngbya cf. ectocarpi LEGE 11479]|uniref:Amino acid adenylation domain-containing protein n=1 Tax=Leptolyngbya cf. ectocarpi LEGE 11479 TaxID=1828722 RepID=A0A928X2W7_LEPEC|nr:non-ribosomal peptide synthetase [Leptolyngbya ectocarpi]MBE9065558.1 amino acid adenylation domain-containing protein [Leptolyngbya cf. ectocarpi LEGE 11479]